MEVQVNAEALKTRLSTLFPDFEANSQVWVYQSNRKLSEQELTTIGEKLNGYANRWKAHGTPVKASAALLFEYFVVFVVDAKTPASGCSIDESVSFMKTLQDELVLDFFDRLQITYVKDEEILHAPLSRTKKGLQEGDLDATDLFFDNSINTLNQLRNSWLKPFKNSWLLPK